MRLFLFLFLLLFFLPELSFGHGVECGCFSADWSANHNDVTDCNVYSSSAEMEEGYSSRRSYTAGCFFLPGFGYYCHDSYDYDLLTYDTGIWVSCPDCDDFDNDGLCDDCDGDAEEECGVARIIWRDRPNCVYECETCQDKATAECGSAEEVDWISPPNCVYECKEPCDDQNPTPSEDCGTSLNIVWVSKPKCLWECKCSNYDPDYVLTEESEYKAYDFATCQWIPQDSPCSIIEMNNQCPLGAVSRDYVNCTSVCVTCTQAQSDCDGLCAYGGTQINCSEGEGGRVGACLCDDPPSQNPTDDPSDGTPSDDPFPGDPDTGASPDPGSSNDPEAGKTCDDYEASCASSCQWACFIDANGSVHHTCDCYSDPVGDDGANGWLEAVEDNTDRSANANEKANEWAKADKHNSDQVLEDTDNIADNTRKGISNDQHYFESGDGESYLKIIADWITSGGGDGDGDGDGEGEDLEIRTTGEGTAPADNIYDISLLEDDGFEPIEDTFTEDLSDYIATGIPLISYLQDTSINLSYASPVLQISLWGHNVDADFSAYEFAINLAGNILFYLTVLSSFMLIITRVKG